MDNKESKHMNRIKEKESMDRQSEGIYAPIYANVTQNVECEGVTSTPEEVNKKSLPLEPQPSLMKQNKSRKLCRRHIPTECVAESIENLKKHICHGLRTIDLSKRNTNNIPFNKSFNGCTANGICSNIANVISIIIHLPCVLFELFKQKWKCGFRCCHSSARRFAPTKPSSVVIMQDFDYFWDPLDISDSETEAYKNLVYPVFKRWLDKRDRESADLIDKEIVEICTNNYLNRLQVWVNLYTIENMRIGEDMSDHRVFWLQISYANGNADIIRTILENRHPASEVVHLTSGAYKGATPLHLSIINKSLKTTQAIIDMHEGGDQYKILHLKAESSMLKQVFPAIELPLNLAVWMGDASAVRTLIYCGAEMCFADSEGNNPFHIAAILGREDNNKACLMLDLLQELIDPWIENTSQCESLMDLSAKTSHLVALHILFKAKNKDGYTPLRLAAKCNCTTLIKKILNQEKIYKFPLHKLGQKSESLYDFSEIDPLLSYEEKSPSVLETLSLSYHDDNLVLFNLSQLQMLLDLKIKRYAPYFLLYILMHLCVMTCFNTSAFLWLYPQFLEREEGANSTSWITGKNRYIIKTVDICMSVIATFYMLTFILGCCIARKTGQRMNLHGKENLWILNCLSLATSGTFALAVYTYIILKALKSNFEIYALSVSMLIGWLHCLFFTRMSKSTAFFTIMIHRVLLGDIMRFLSIIGIIVLGYSMMTCAVFMADTKFADHPDINVGPLSVMFDFFQLATGIADFKTLQESSHRFYSTLIYMSFLVLANVLLFNLLIASMSNRYASISDNGELLCRKVRCCDLILLEWLMPTCMKDSAKEIYEHRIFRIRLSDNQYIENEVYLLSSPDNGDDVLIDTPKRRMSRLH